MSVGSVKKEEEEIWQVKSENNDLFYKMFKIKDSSRPCFNIMCNECGVCTHQYSCTCMDFLLQTTICKHIHLVEPNPVADPDGGLWGLQPPLF